MMVGYIQGFENFFISSKFTTGILPEMNAIKHFFGRELPYIDYLWCQFKWFNLSLIKTSCEEYTYHA